MYKIFLLSACLLIATISFSQTEDFYSAKSGKKEVSADEKIFLKAEVEATFPGGGDAWFKFLQKNLKPKVPIKKGAPAGTYQVIARFIVAKDGSISAVAAETTHGYGMEEEVVRVLQKGPKWIPAMQDGRPVKAYRRQAITFVISEK